MIERGESTYRRRLTPNPGGFGSGGSPDTLAHQACRTPGCGAGVVVLSVQAALRLRSIVLCPGFNLIYQRNRPQEKEAVMA